MTHYHSIHGAGGLTVLVGEYGRILHLQGDSVSAPPSPTRQDLLCVSVLGPGCAFAAGRSGSLLRWDGSSWSALCSGTQEDLFSLYAPHPHEAWAGGRNVLLRWQSGSISLHRRFLDLSVLAIWPDGPHQLGFLSDGRLLLRWDGRSLRDLYLPDPEGDRLTFHALAWPLLCRSLPAEAPEPSFWSLVSSLGWGRRSTDYASLAQELARSVPLFDLLALEARFDSLRSLLHTRLDRWEHQSGAHLAVSDDGLLDLTSHIVGLGQDEFSATLKDPSRAARRAQQRDFRESFAYVFSQARDLVPTEELVRALRDCGALRHYTPGAEAAHEEPVAFDFPDHPDLGPGFVLPPLTGEHLRVLFSSGQRLLPRPTAAAT